MQLLNESESAQTPKEDDANTGRVSRDGSVSTMAWEDPRNPENPLYWDGRRKWVNVLLVSSQAMLSPISCTILAIGSQEIASDFGLSNVYTLNLPVGMYVLGLGLGPLYLAPLSEIKGRRLVYIISFSLFTIFNIGCALAPNITALSILRFVSGAFGSAGPTLGGASIGDMFHRRDRGKAQAIYAMGPTAGPIIGPLIGAFIVNGTHGWRWLMWLMVIAPGLTVVLCAFFLKETYAPVLLRKKHTQAKKPSDAQNSPESFSIDTIKSLSRCAISRPFKLLFLSPICTVLSVYMALIYGILFLHLITVPLLYGPEPIGRLFSYQWQNGITGLAYLGAGIGCVVGTFICTKYLNRSYAYMQGRHLQKTGSEDSQPESRMPFLQLGMTIVPIGLVIFAWSAEYHVQWIVPLIGAAIFSLGMLMAYVCIQTYLVDAYESYAASALAAMIFARSATSCVFAVTGFQLYESLGYAWGTMVIAFICIGMLPIPFLIYKYGAYLRKSIRREEGSLSASSP